MPRAETELYEPIRSFLEAQGYAVQAEVDRCDITARRGEDLIVIELKRQFGTRLLLQAIDRQQITDSVYVALPGPMELGRGSRWHGIRRLLRRLELGLLVVTFEHGRARVEVVFHPLPSERRKLKRRRRAVLREMAGRSVSRNQGGSTRRRLLTAYRESAIRIACALDALGPSRPRTLRALGTGPKTLSILSNNYYGWFTRIDRGVYDLTPEGRRGLAQYAELARRFAAEIKAREAPAADTPPPDPC